MHILIFVSQYNFLWYFIVAGCDYRDTVHATVTYLHPSSTIYVLLLDLTDCGWLKKDGKFSIQWETLDNIDRVQKCVQYLTKGCNCTKGCATARCECKKNSLHCGPSCHCLDCLNKPQSTLKDVETMAQPQKLPNLLSEEENTDDDDDKYGAVRESDYEKINGGNIWR